MLRHHSHGFNLEENSLDVPQEFLSAKEKVKKGEHLDQQKLVEDWEPHAI